MGHHLLVQFFFVQNNTLHKGPVYGSQPYVQRCQKFLINFLFPESKKKELYTKQNLNFTKVPTFLKETTERGALCWGFYNFFVRD